MNRSENRLHTGLALKGTGLERGLEMGIRVKKRKLHHRLEGEVTKFCQENDEERTGWSNEEFFSSLSPPYPFPNKRDLYLKKLEERGRMQCGKGRDCK